VPCKLVEVCHVSARREVPLGKVVSQPQTLVDLSFIFSFVFQRQDTHDLYSHSNTALVGYIYLH
jgi:hypothetical protein